MTIDLTIFIICLSVCFVFSVLITWILTSIFYKKRYLRKIAKLEENLIFEEAISYDPF